MSQRPDRELPTTGKFSDRIYTALNHRHAAYDAWQRSEGGTKETAALDAADDAVREIMATCDDLLEACRAAFDVLAGVEMNKAALGRALTSIQHAIAKAEGR